MFEGLFDVVDGLGTTAKRALSSFSGAEETPVPLFDGISGGGPVDDAIAASLGVDMDALRDDYSDTDGDYGTTGDYSDTDGDYGTTRDYERGDDGDYGSEFYDGVPDGERPPQSVDLFMIDDTDYGGQVAETWAAGEVTGFRDMHGLVDLALEHAGGDPLGTLAVRDHGKPGVQEIGDGDLSIESLQDPAMVETLAKLRDGFGDEGALELMGCQLGAGEKGEAFLREMANTLDVPVTGGFQYQTPLFPGYEGATKTCYPSTIDADGAAIQKCIIENDDAGAAMWNLALEAANMNVNEVK